MKIIAAFFSLLIFSLGSFAQASEKILATANNKTFTAKDLSSEARQALENLPASIAGLRRQLLEQQIVDALLGAEAAAQKTTAEKLFETQINKRVQAPTAQQIQAVYNANREEIGTKTLAEVRPQIVEFLRRDAERKLYGDYVSNLKIKHKVALGVKDVNAANLSPLEVLATVGGKQISAQSFEVKNKAALNDFEANVYDAVRGALEQIVYSNLIAAESKAQNVEPENFIAREITDKMRNFSDGERAELETNLRKRLFQKYNAKFLLKEIPLLTQVVSTDDDPSQGSVNAPVTVVMFSDFQCPACGATHPVLKKVVAEYGGERVRFVERDFPLTQIHQNAFRAALAAGAANAQGKFFEYVELLYANQNSLDTASLKEFASKIGLDRKRFDADLGNEKYAAEIRKDIEDGKKYGINATPTIYVNGVKVRELSAEAFRAAIDNALNK